MESDYDKKLRMEALNNVVNRRKQQRQDDYIKAKSSPDKSMNLAKGTLDKDVLTVKSSAPADVTPEVTKVRGTQKINTMGEAQDLISGKDFTSKINDIKLKGDLKATMEDAIKRGDHTMMNKLKQVATKFSKNAGKGLKSIPILGSAIGLASAIGSDDASAAIPILDSAESLGPQKGSLDYRLENGMLTEEDKEELKRQTLLNMKNMSGR